MVVTGPSTRRFSPSRTARVSPSRALAFQVLSAVDDGAYASDQLRDLGSSLASRDAALAGQIVFGVLRFRLQLDHAIQVYASRPVSLESGVANILRMAVFQLRYLERVPPHAVVHEAVELAKLHHRAASGLVNAVLRKVNRAPMAWPNRAVRLSCPTFLLARWDAHFGAETSDAIASAALEEPIPYIRVAPGSAPPENVVLEAAGNLPGAYRIVGGEKAGLRLHDIGSQSIVPQLELRDGERYLDLCSAPGNKTRQALETRLALALACDISSRRLATVDVANRVVLDGTALLPFPPGTFDCVLIDAPCSGTGTLGRNPEIKWRVQTHDFRDFGEKQKSLVGQASQVLKPGGRLLYATCSLEREENEDVVRRMCNINGELRVEKEVWRIPGRDPGDGFYAALLRRSQ